MRDDTGPTLSVGEFVEYCQTQAGLLSGHVETMAEEADELLDEIDTMVADIRSKLEGHPNTQGTTGPSSTTEPGGEDVDISEAEELATTLEQKQAIVEAKQARMQAFQKLAANYTELAADLQSTVDDPQEAVHRIVEFEVDADAPVYFDERETLAEAAAAASEDDETAVDTALEDETVADAADIASSDDASGTDRDE
ncbi:hypothetical protein [Natronolimnobius baerhuensis]|uniref:Uncharacterized protein n=1 Tax=Natronolimnobius baerhuensis TaxID=253108 RepID=A0A202EAN6_9EURY|nr:hypothetical protein [Natronolimnobius baerhuensis]OVE85312.1 hypothetical protein B2G88_00330 [Natronolimnobius baerhuensis]